MIFAAFPMPPLVLKTRGVKDPFSISQTLCSYAWHFHSRGVYSTFLTGDHGKRVSLGGIPSHHAKMYSVVVVPKSQVSMLMYVWVLLEDSSSAREII